jgi:hypothetical protein
MKKSIVKVACAVLILLMVIAGASACNSTRVNQITEGALQAVIDGDYETYIGYFIPSDREYLTETEFNDVSQLLSELIGEFISWEFVGVGEQYGYLTVTYDAEFSKEPAGVTITFYFQDTVSAPHYLVQRMGWEELYHQELYVAGIWFNSPNIQDYLEENAY